MSNQKVSKQYNIIPNKLALDNFFREVNLEHPLFYAVFSEHLIVMICIHNP